MTTGENQALDATILSAFPCLEHLQGNIESTKLVLIAEDLKEIATALAEFKVYGGRMNEEQMKVVEQ